ncbi:MAG: porin family protein [Mariniphaga sp.]
MKKLFLTITLMTVLLSTFAQLPFTFNLGLKGGINSSKITTDNATLSGYTFNDFKSEAQSGYHIGAFARLGGKKIYFQPELLYCVKKGQSISGMTDQTLNLKTIQVPVLLGFKLIDLKLASVRVFTGPAMSYVLAGSSVNVNDVRTPLFDIKNFKNNVWDWQLGGGIDLGMLTFDVRYEWGISNLSGGNTSNMNMGFVNKGNTLSFSVGIKFI